MATKSSVSGRSPSSHRRRISAASRSASAFTSDEDGGASTDIEGNPAGQVPEDPADTPGVQPGLVGDLSARVSFAAEKQNGQVLRRAGGQQHVPGVRGPGLFAR